MVKCNHPLCNRQIGPKRKMCREHYLEQLRTPGTLAHEEALLRTQTGGEAISRRVVDELDEEARQVLAKLLVNGVTTKKALQAARFNMLIRQRGELS